MLHERRYRKFVTGNVVTLTRIRILQISTTLTVGAKIHEYCELFMIIVVIRSLSTYSKS